MQSEEYATTPVNGRPPPGMVSPQSPAREPGESWLLRTGLSVSVWTLAGVATLLAASGQVQFARWAGITDLRAYAVPAVLELVAVAFLLIGYRRARRGDSPSALWLLAAAIGAFAVYTNVVHSGGRSGLVFGAASAITLILWFVKLRDDYRHFQRHTGQATRPRPKLGALWLVAPRLSARAWVLAARRRISTVDEAVGYAEVWRAVYEDARSAKVRRRLARRTAWRSVAEVAGGVYAELPRTAEVAAVNVVQRGSDGPTRESLVAAERLAGAVTAGPAGTPAATTAATATPAPTGTARASGTDLAVMGHPGHENRRNGAGGPGSLRSRVFAFLDSQVKIEDYFDIGDGDDPYLLWMTARGLGVGVDAIAEHVRDWCRQTAQRHGEEFIPTRP
jgi:hypothetical protein